MIIILNGMYGTHIENLSKIISYELNKNDYYGLLCSYEIDENNSFNINSNCKLSNGTTIHIDSSDVYQTNEEELEKLKEMHEKLNISLVNEELSDYFVKSFKYDNKIDEVPDFYIDDKPSYMFNSIDFSPSEIVKRYKESSLKYYVICGQIGKHMIDEISKLAGKSKVKVYNIVRNPTVADFIFKSMYGEVTSAEMCHSIYNGIAFNQNGITTFKYEDICKELSIKIEEVDIKLPSNFKLKYNKLSQFECNNKILLEYFNNRTHNFKYSNLLFANFDLIKFWYNEESEESEESTKMLNELNERNIPLRKIDAFTILNYEKVDETNLFKGK